MEVGLTRCIISQIVLLRFCSIPCSFTIAQSVGTRSPRDTVCRYESRVGVILSVPWNWTSQLLRTLGRAEVSVGCEFARQVCQSWWCCCSWPSLARHDLIMWQCGRRRDSRVNTTWPAGAERCLSLERQGVHCAAVSSVTSGRQ